MLKLQVGQYRELNKKIPLTFMVGVILTTIKKIIIYEKCSEKKLWLQNQQQ